MSVWSLPKIRSSLKSNPKSYSLVNLVYPPDTHGKNEGHNLFQLYFQQKILLMG